MNIKLYTPKSLQAGSSMSSIKQFLLVIDHLKENVTYKDISSSLKSLMSIEFPEYAYMNSVFLSDMKAYRDRCMLMMNISQEDLDKFSEQHTSKKADADRAAIKEKLMKEYLEHQETLEQAREKLNG